MCEIEPDVVREIIKENDELKLIIWSILDSVDILNDGPDESDKAHAESIFHKAITAAKEFRKEHPAT